VTKILGVSDTTLRNWERDDVVPRDPATRVLDTLRLAVLGLHDADIHGEEAYTWLTSADTSGWLDGARPVDVIAESSTFVLAAVEDEVLHVLADKPARQRTYHLPLQPARPVRARRGDSHRADAGGKPKRATTTKRRAAKRRVAPKDCD
jgi:hypothetical protein